MCMKMTTCGIRITIYVAGYAPENECTWNRRTYPSLLMDRHLDVCSLSQERVSGRLGTCVSGRILVCYYQVGSTVRNHQECA
mmetsp:Transcript_7773/g.16880  ORF Transcript_7773/g.16880 Transcript_7773/m.16880 type:complete len:82 (+) Transcript_7773:26-271(+)